MNRLCSLAVVATVVCALRVDARACDPVGTFPHTVDMSMQAADQTPPTLPAIPAPIVHYADDTSDGVGCGGAKCGDVTYVGIPAVATDDMTDRYRIGYRLSLESGTLPVALFAERVFYLVTAVFVTYFVVVIAVVPRDQVERRRLAEGRGRPE